MSIVLFNLVLYCIDAKHVTLKKFVLYWFFSWSIVGLHRTVIQITTTSISHWLLQGKTNTNSRILKANSSWSPTWAKFYQLTASLSVVLPQLNLRKLKTWVLEVRLLGQERKVQTHTKIFLHHSSSTFFEFSSSLLLEYGKFPRRQRKKKTEK